MYYITEDFKQLIRNLGGEWNDQKKRPIVCLMQSTEHPDLYWAIPVGKVNHRDDKAMERIKSFMNKPTRDLRCCYYHIATKITIRVYVSETYLPEKKRPYTKKAKKKLTLQRARYPERRKEDGAFLIEKDCPSCGANFIPDANHCCSFCGYGLQVDTAKWVAAATEE